MSPGLNVPPINKVATATTTHSLIDAKEESMGAKPNIHEVAVLDSNCPYQALLNSENIEGKSELLVWQQMTTELTRRGLHDM